MSEQRGVHYLVAPSRAGSNPPEAVRAAFEDVPQDVVVRVGAFEDWPVVEPLDTDRHADSSRVECGDEADGEPAVVVVGVETAADWEQARAMLESRAFPPVVLYADSGVVHPEALSNTESLDVAGFVQRGGAESGAVLAAEVVRVGAAHHGSVAPVDGDHFQAVAAVASDAVVTIDESSTIRFVSEAITDQLGYDPSELVGGPLTVLMPQSLAREHREGFQRYVETGDRRLDWEYLELTGQHADGYTVPLGISFCEFEQNGERFFTGILRDISDRGDLEERRQHEQRVLEQVVETMPAGLVILTDSGDVQRMNGRAEEIVGASRETIRTSEDLFEFYDEDDDRIPPDDLVFSDVLEDGEPVYDHVVKLERPDGEHRWLSVNGARLEDADGDDVVRGIFTLEDVTNARTRAERLRRLTDRLRDLPEHETKDGLSDAVVHAVRETIDVDAVAAALYEPEAGVLRTTAGYRANETNRPADRATSPKRGAEGRPTGEDGTAPSAVGSDPARSFQSGSDVWEGFIRNETRLVDWPAASRDAHEDSRAETGETQAVAASMGQHGVLLVRPAVDVESIGDVRDYVEIIAAVARSAFNRVDREADIREQRDLLQEKTGRLERVEQVNHAIRRITQVLLQAESQAEIEQLVCEELADVEPYALVWFGHVDTETEAVEPTAVAGRDQEYLERIGASHNGPGGVTGPIGTAVQTGEVTVRNSILDESSGDAWREAALERGFQSIATIPVEFRGTHYGTLNLYAGQPGQFEHLEQAVLEEMSQTIGFAMRSLERKHAFVSERSVELELRVPAVEDDVLGFLDADAGSVTVENMVLQMNGGLHLFFRPSGVDVDRLRDRAFDANAVETFTRITDDGDDPLYECTVRGNSVVSMILERGARFEAFEVAGGSLDVTLRIPQRAEVRDYVDIFEDAYGAVELLAKREVDESVMTAREFEEDVRNALTARQEEVIKTAFYSGYFEWPRESTGGEVADILDVTQPTVNRHIRTGERTLFGQLYGDTDDRSADAGGSDD